MTGTGGSESHSHPNVPNGQSLKVLSEAIGPGFLECGGKRSATPLFLLSFSDSRGSIALNALGLHRRGKRRCPLRFAGAVQNRDWWWRIFPGITNVIIRESDCFACAGGDRNRGRARIDGGRGRRFA